MIEYFPGFFFNVSNLFLFFLIYRISPDFAGFFLISWIFFPEFFPNDANFSREIIPGFIFSVFCRIFFRIFSTLLELLRFFFYFSEILGIFFFLISRNFSGFFSCNFSDCFWIFLLIFSKLFSKWNFRTKKRFH